MRDKSVDSADVLDALVAAIIARMLAVGLCEPVPSESLGAARQEGWIHVPRSDSLSRVLSLPPQEV